MRLEREPVVWPQVSAGRVDLIAFLFIWGAPFHHDGANDGVPLRGGIWTVSLERGAGECCWTCLDACATWRLSRFLLVLSWAPVIAPLIAGFIRAQAVAVGVSRVVHLQWSVAGHGTISTRRRTRLSRLKAQSCDAKRQPQFAHHLRDRRTARPFSGGQLGHQPAGCCSPIP